MRRIVLLFVGLLFITNFSAQAQNSTLSGNYQQAFFTDMISDLESRYDVKFFYNPQLDSTVITMDFQELSLEKLVEKITKISNINFTIRNGNMVVSTDEFIVDPQLNPVLFNEKRINQNKPTSRGGSILENIRETAEQDKDKRLENQIAEIGEAAKRFDGQTATIAGYVKEAKSLEPVIGASVFKKEPLVGVVTDQFGFFSFTLPKGRHEVFINSTGMKGTKRQIMLYSDGNMNVELRDDIISLKEVVVTGEKNSIENLQTGFANLNMKNIKQIPSIMGEADIMKIALTLPGVQTVGEGAAGFNVRGGSADQNLVLLNDVPVYNTNHLFGFFSVFNPDVIASANLYKSGIGANYGGRIASVFDVALRDGNKKRFTYKGGISPVTGKITLEGPIKKDTSSYILGIRSTYSDYIFSLLDDPNLRNSTGAFSDVVTKVTHRIDEKNELILSAYHSRDKFRLNSDTVYRYFNTNAAIHWRKTYSNQLNSISSISFANYNYDLSSDDNPTRAFNLDYSINHYGLKSEFNYFPKEKVNVKFGLSSTLYSLQPGIKNALGSESIVSPITLSKEKGLESALFGGYEYEVNSLLSVYGGVRLTMFNSIGPGLSFTYGANGAREPQYITDTTFHSAGSISQTYLGPEVRLSGRYKLRDDLSLKFSYDRMNQYIHVMSNTTAISPTDTWRLSGPGIKPQRGNQFSAGLYKTFYGTSLEFSGEAYFKKVNNVLEYKDGANLLLNEALETDIINAKGKAYGIELLLKKNSGKFSGWLSYTFARSLIQANGGFPSERINGGEYYPSNFDKPHSIVLVSNYKINRRVNISFNVNYSTGRPATFPLTKYFLKGQPVLLYTDRNKFRIPHYFRTDVAVNFEGNHRVHKKIHGSWSLSVYNLTSRANAYSVFFQSEDGEINGYKLSVFKNAVPTITYHFALN
ncbi:MAG: carboxypeptidase-like regulatory domain-containing protein [Cyclobacteriaceae bacterium]